jgi:hypothetical protein
LQPFLKVDEQFSTITFETKLEIGNSNFALKSKGHLKLVDIHLIENQPKGHSFIWRFDYFEYEGELEGGGAGAGAGGGIILKA